MSNWNNNNWNKVGNRQYNNGNWNKNNYQNGPRKKHSGAKSGMTRSGESKEYIHGWNYSKRNGMTTFYCRPHSKTKVHTSQRGNEFENWVCTVTNGFKSHLVSCLYSVTTGKVVISEYGIVINPKAPNGGYCGTFVKR